MLGFEEICGRRRGKGDPAPHFGLVREMSATGGGADDWVEYKNVVVEPSEEVRLLLTKLLCFLIKAANKIIYPFASDVASTLMAVANDSCPNVLVETFVALEVLGDVMGDKLKPISKQLVSVVLPSLSHNQSKVRLAAIRAIHRLILCGAHESIYQLTAFQDPNLVPIRAFYHLDIKTQYLALLASDKNVSVRRELLQTVVSWLQNLSERKEHEVRLLPYVISALNDPNPQLQDLAFVSMEELGEQEVAEGIVMLSKRMVVSLRGECEETLSVLWILTNAIAVAELCKRSTAEAENVLEGLAKTSGYSSAASLAAAYMSQLISLLRHPSLWTGWSLEVLIVARFLKMANLAYEFAVDKLLGFVEYFTNTSINTEINLRLLLAMRTMLISTPSGYFMTEHAQAIIESFIKACIDAEGQLHQPACEMRDILLKIHSKCIPLSLAPLRKEFSGLELADLEGTLQEKPERDPMLG